MRRARGCQLSQRGFVLSDQPVNLEFGMRVEQILRTLGAQFMGEPGTTENGVLLLQEYMRELGYTPDQYRMVDGSGLSKTNLVTPDQVIALLEDAHSDLSIFPEFISALGVMGLDGSVEDRMDDNKDA